MTPEFAMLRALSALTPAVAASVTGFSEAYLRACSDPDNKREINFESALALDMACKAEAGETPFFDVMRLMLEGQGSDTEVDIPSALLDLHEQASELSAVVRAGQAASSPGGAAFTASEKMQIHAAATAIIAEVQLLLTVLEGKPQADKEAA